MKNNLWFKRKKYGWGWTPANSTGWLVIAIYVFGVSLYPSLAEFGYFTFSIGIFLALTFLMTIGLIVICFKKGEKPAWQWGE